MRRMYLIDCAGVGLGILKRLDGAVHRNDRGILESNLVGILITDRNNISEQGKVVVNSRSF